jgi:hypothetical protein
MTLTERAKRKLGVRASAYVEDHALRTRGGSIIVAARYETPDGRPTTRVSRFQEIDAAPPAVVEAGTAPGDGVLTRQRLPTHVGRRLELPTPRGLEMTTPTKKRGRPSLGLTTELEVRASPALLQLITSASDAAGLSRSEWMRRAALYYLAAGAPSAVPELADDDPEAP